MRLGIGIKRFSWPGAPASIGPWVARIARRADESGVASLWVMDHYFQIPAFGAVEEPMLEAYATLAWIAGQTTRLEIGAMVTAAPYRHPGALIKAVTTLDVLSGGRAWLGIGAAWNDLEARSLGIPFPPLAERFERLEETLQIAHQMWAGDERPFHGRHYALDRPLNSPNALRRPHPPIMVGGGGERKTLRLVARYADACNLFPYLGLETLRHKLDVLRRHCDAEGRSYQAIQKTTYSQMAMRDGDAALAAARRELAQLADLGIDHAIVEPARPWDDEALSFVERLTSIASDLASGGS